MQLKTVMRYHLTPVRMAVTKKDKRTTVGEAVEKREHLCTVSRNDDWCSHDGKQCRDSSKIRTRPTLYFIYSP